MISINDVKNYLYIPNCVTNDDLMINNFINVAYAYLRGAIDNFDLLYEQNIDFANQSDFFATVYTADLFQNRNQYSKNDQPGFVAQALMLQLQTYTLITEEEDKENE